MPASLPHQRGIDCPKVEREAPSPCRRLRNANTRSAFPIGAFVALGFEHCVANLYLLPVGMLSGANVGLGEFIGNIVPVTFGNTVGGVGLAAAYWVVYLSDGTARVRPFGWRSAAAPVDETPPVGYGRDELAAR